VGSGDIALGDRRPLWHPTTMIEVRHVERAVEARAPDAIDVILQTLEALERGEGFGDAETPAEGYARLAIAVAAALVDPTTPLAPATRDRLTLYTGLAANLFSASPQRSAAAALEALHPVGLPKDPEELARYLLLLGPDTPAPVEVADILALPAPHALLAALNIVATKPLLTPLGATRRAAVSTHAGALGGLEAPATFSTLAILTNAWMNCSYGSAPDKHALKPALNAVFRSLAGRLGLADLPSPQPRVLKDRPTLVVAAEVIQQNHVQFRYFGQYLRQLRTRFELILVAPRQQVTPRVPELFDRVFTFDALSAGFLHEIVRFIAGVHPDLIFWPSVGMARWGPLLANLRLAPIQLTALGHSASTFIPAIDYYLTEQGYVGDPALFSETLLLLPDDSLVFEPQPDAAPPAPRARSAEPDQVRVAVPSNALKLNPAFMATLDRIRRASRRPVEFHIFPNCTPLEAAALRAAWSEILGGAIVYPMLGRQPYADLLNACDLVLSPFPFGGLHSTVDALSLGLPVAAMEGLEPHGRTDAVILRRLGLPEALIAQTEDAYVRTAVELIDDGDKRLEMGRLALAADAGRLFAKPGQALRTEVVDAVWAAYRRHEEILAGGRRAWSLEELTEGV
jgi:hypothetical protein